MIDVVLIHDLIDLSFCHVVTQLGEGVLQRLIGYVV